MWDVGTTAISKDISISRIPSDVTYFFHGEKFLSCFLGLGLEKKEVRVLKALKSRRSKNQETFFETMMGGGRKNCVVFRTTMHDVNF